MAGGDLGTSILSGFLAGMPQGWGPGGERRLGGPGGGRGSGPGKEEEFGKGVDDGPLLFVNGLEGNLLRFLSFSFSVSLSPLFQDPEFRVILLGPLFTLIHIVGAQ